MCSHGTGDDLDLGALVICLDGMITLLEAGHQHEDDLSKLSALCDCLVSSGTELTEQVQYSAALC